MLLRLVEDVERAIDHECFFAALALALALPDICGKAEYPTEKSTRKRYKDWCREYVCKTYPRDDPISGDMPYLNQDIIYSLRCSLLHQGNPSIEVTKEEEKHWDDRCVVDHFSLEIVDPGGADGEFAMVEYDRYLKIGRREIQVGVRDLCYRLRVAAKKYYEENPDKFTFFDFDIKDRRKKNNPFNYLLEDE